MRAHFFLHCCVAEYVFCWVARSTLDERFNYPSGNDIQAHVREQAAFYRLETISIVNQRPGIGTLGTSSYSMSLRLSTRKRM